MFVVTFFLVCTKARNLSFFIFFTQQFRTETRLFLSKDHRPFFSFARYCLPHDGFLRHAPRRKQGSTRVGERLHGSACQDLSRQRDGRALGAALLSRRGSSHPRRDLVPHPLALHGPSRARVRRPGQRVDRRLSHIDALGDPRAAVGDRRRGRKEVGAAFQDRTRLPRRRTVAVVGALVLCIWWGPRKCGKKRALDRRDRASAGSRALLRAPRLHHRRKILRTGLPDRSDRARPRDL